ncbi:MAG: FAD-binding oxidoreductase, partial [Gammaproteobacteria bacterium]|nr:FAD-binding oxidoreductase [Gammaproteobacteria bacterium]
MQHSFDVVIIGGGIAGASLAYQLCREHRVLLLERETQAGYHATGRSAALFSTTYGNDTIQTLSRMSEAFFRCPPPGFCAAPLLQPRGALLIARHEQRDSLAARLGTPGTQWLEGAALQELVPVLRADTIAAGLYEPQASDVDVASLHEGFLRALRTRPDCRLCLESGVVALESRADGWHVRTERASYVAPLLVNAAGAWADELAALAGLRPGGLLPKKRTA